MEGLIKEIPERQLHALTCMGWDTANTEEKEACCTSATHYKEWGMIQTRRSQFDWRMPSVFKCIAHYGDYSVHYIIENYKRIHFRCSYQKGVEISNMVTRFIA